MEEIDMTKSASKPERKRGRIALITLAVLILALTAVFFVYTQDYYHADETAKALFTTNPAVKTEQSLTILSPDAQTTAALD